MERCTLEAMLTDLLKDLHSHPEVAFEEVYTTARIREILTGAGITILDTDLKTGLIAQIDGPIPGGTVALRCDIDALPVQEQSGLSYASCHPGKMHACGHDFHATVMVGAALLLKERQQDIAGTVKIIFQPAEEVDSGSRVVLATGKANADVYFGVHSYPLFKAGTLGIKPGPVMAAVDRFKVTLKGVGCHGAQPSKGVDPIPALAALVQSLQTLVSRNTDPFQPAVLSVTRVQSGTTWNVIPETAEMEGTVRTMDAAVRETIVRRFREVTEGVAAAYGVQAEIDWIAGSGAVVNDLHLIGLAGRVARRLQLNVLEQEDTMGGEDFSNYLQQAPGLFIRVGTDGDYPGHHPKFTVDPAAAAPAATYFAELAIAFLEEKASNQSIF